MLLSSLISCCIKLIKSKRLEVAVDSTGFSIDHASHYYAKRIDRKEPIKGFVKLSIAVCLANSLVLSSRVRKHHANDNKDFKPLLNKVCKPISLIIADKGYDSEKNHVFCRDNLKAESVIPLRRHTFLRSKTKGKYRKSLRSDFPQKKYNKRNTVESTISAVKRPYGSTLKSRMFRTQRIELLSKILAYNAKKIALLSSFFN
jgi:transposase